MPVDGGETPAIPAQPRMTEEPSAPGPAAPSIQPAPTTTDVSSIEQYALVKSSKNFFLLQSSTLARRCPILTRIYYIFLRDFTYVCRSYRIPDRVLCVENGHTKACTIFRRLLLSWCERHIRFGF